MDDKEIKKIIKTTIKIRENAYAKYSKFKVGALVIDAKDNYYYGVNVENASYGLTNCAERTAIFNGITNGMREIKTICIVGDTEQPVSPCGACRQVIKEFANKDTKIIVSNLNLNYKVFKIEELLPYGFDSDDL